MRPDILTRALGLALLVSAVPAFLWAPDSSASVLAVGLGTVGLYVAVVVAARVVPADTAQALLAGGSAPLQEVAAGLKLNGCPIYVHDQGNVGEERMFLPASDDERPVPVLDASTLVYSAGAETRRGIAIPPPGLALVQAHAKATANDIKGASVPELEAFLQGLGATGDTARSVEVTGGGADITVRFAAGALRPPCFDDPSVPVCESTGCALCQAVGCALARGLERPIVVAEAVVDAPTVTLRFRGEGT